MFKKLFGKSSKAKAPKGFHELTIQAIERIANDSVKVIFDVPSDKASSFAFEAGQYINVSVDINGTQERRSYSICSGKNEALAIGIKQVENGKVSTWFNTSAEAGQSIFVSTPEGNFTRPNNSKSIVAIAAGSGITPILSIAKDIEHENGKLQLFYGSRTENSILFKSEIDSLSSTTCSYYLSGEEKEGFSSGRIDSSAFSTIIKSNLDLLKSDGFFLCGPEQMIVDVKEVLSTFGVPDEKIHFELFTTPVLMAEQSTSDDVNFDGTSAVTVLLDDEKIDFELKSDGPSILDKVIKEGLDAPYSCQGGVCSACKAKVIDGKAKMDLNYSLTDGEIDEGYILTCQSHPASEKLTVTYDI